MKLLTALLRLVRFPNLLMIFLTQWLVALFLSSLPVSAGYVNIGLLTLSTICIAAAGYVINDYYDVDIDAVNKPDKLIIGRFIKPETALYGYALLNAAGIGAGFYLSPLVGSVSVACAVLLWVYSAYLKKLPFWGNLIVSMLTAAAVVLISLYEGIFSAGAIVFTAFAFIVSLVREIIKDIEDREGDVRYGCRTLPIILGDKPTKHIISFITALLMVMLAVLAYFYPFPVILAYSASLIAFLVFFLFQLYKAATQQHYHTLSIFCKLIMLSGILLIIVF